MVVDACNPSNRLKEENHLNPGGGDWQWAKIMPCTPAWRQSETPSQKQKKPCEGTKPTVNSTYREAQYYNTVIVVYKVIYFCYDNLSKIITIITF